MILKASCNRCKTILEANEDEPYKITVDYNGEILCDSCKIDDKNREIIIEIKNIKSLIIHQNKNILELESKLVKSR